MALVRQTHGCIPLNRVQRYMPVPGRGICSTMLQLIAVDTGRKRNNALSGYRRADWKPAKKGTVDVGTPKWQVAVPEFTEAEIPHGNE